MSRFFSERFARLRPYTPGEQPQDMQYVKLNTNESPFPPPEAVCRAIAAECGRLQLYSDPDCKALIRCIAGRYGVGEEQVIVGNGSDELLNFAFAAFADEDRPLAFPDISYGFYPVFAAQNRIPYREIPLREDFSLAVEDYQGVGGCIVIANPNAPTGMALSRSEIARIVRSNPDAVVIVDEAYVDFGAESAVPLLREYENLLVIQTFSKSRSLAGARLGFAIGSAALIADLNTLRCSVNPYNVNRMTLAAGAASLENDEYNRANCRRIEENRAYTAKQLRRLRFRVLDSRANFLFARSERIGGEELYRALKARGVLVRHFDKARIRDYIRITIGTREQMDILLDTVRSILKEREA